MRTRIAAILAALALALGIGFIPTTAQAEPTNQTTATATTTINEPIPSDPTKKPAPAVLTAAQQQELAAAGFTETETDVYYSADHGTWVKDSKGHEVMTDAWITARTFDDAYGNSLVLKDNGYIDATETDVPTGTFILTDVSLAPQDDKAFWCGYSGQDWTVQGLLNDAARQRNNVNAGVTATFVPELGFGDVLAVVNDGGAWCYTKADEA